MLTSVRLTTGKQVKHPFIYGIIRLFDVAGHEGAKNFAAMIRDSIANDEPCFIQFSVEGQTLNKNGASLKNSIVRGVALTKRAANKVSFSGIIVDPAAPEGFEKKPGLPVSEGLVKHEDPAAAVSRP